MITSNLQVELERVGYTTLSVLQLHRASSVLSFSVLTTAFPFSFTFPCVTLSFGTLSSLAYCAKSGIRRAVRGRRAHKCT